MSFHDFLPAHRLASDAAPGPFDPHRITAFSRYGKIQCVPFFLSYSSIPITSACLLWVFPTTHFDSFSFASLYPHPLAMLSYFSWRPMSCCHHVHVPPPEQTYLAEIYQTIVDNHWRNIHLETCTRSFHRGLDINYRYTDVFAQVPCRQWTGKVEGSVLKEVREQRRYRLPYRDAALSCSRCFCRSWVHRKTRFWYRSSRRYREWTHETYHRANQSNPAAPN